MSSEDLFDRYILNKLTQSELIEIESKFQQDPEFKNKFENHKQLVHVIESIELEKTMNNIHDTLDATERQKDSGKSKNIGKWIIIALGITSLILLLFLFPKNERQYELLYTEYLNLDPGLPTTMSGSKQVVFDKGMVAYKNNEYKAALNQWSELEEPITELDFYRGQSYMQQEEFEMAFDCFSRIEKQNNTIYQERVEWYLAMLEFKNHTTGRLQEIKNKSNHAFNKKAKELLSKLQ